MQITSMVDQTRDRIIQFHRLLRRMPRGLDPNVVDPNVVDPETLHPQMESWVDDITGVYNLLSSLGTSVVTYHQRGGSQN